MTVLLALAAAALYGLSDFVGGVASRRSSVWPVGLLACAGALAGSLVIALVTSGDPTSGQVGWALLAGVGSGLGTAFLYRGLAGGRMGVVAPVSGVGAVLVPLVVGVVGGDRPAALAWLGIALALPGIWFVAREPSTSPASGGPSGLLDGVLAGLGFGLLFAALGQVPESAGYWPLVGTQVVSVLTLATAALLLGGDPVPRVRADLGGLVAGVLASLAVLFFLLATSHGLLSIAAVITALYPAFTVLLAMVVLRERVHAAQAVGLGLCAASVVLVSVA
ncbi:EamA family transporter [Marmoricola sp. RAF53]|uniref:EamA family transporter n=1 Tax=Marmoricola sp. RAF53 TaxID=3233059 RepID=UPI003F9D7E59